MKGWSLKLSFEATLRPCSFINFLFRLKGLEKRAERSEAIVFILKYNKLIKSIKARVARLVVAFLRWGLLLYSIILLLIIHHLFSHLCPEW